MVVSALDPDVIIVVRHNVKLVGRQSLRLITCVRVWYTILRLSLLPSDELVMDMNVVALPMNVIGILQANSVHSFFRVGLESDVVYARRQYALDYGSRIVD